MRAPRRHESCLLYFLSREFISFIFAFSLLSRPAAYFSLNLYRAPAIIIIAHGKWGTRPCNTTIAKLNNIFAPGARAQSETFFISAAVYEFFTHTAHFVAFGKRNYKFGSDVGDTYCKLFCDMKKTWTEWKCVLANPAYKFVITKFNTSLRSY